MTLNELFNTLDLDKDGVLFRSELHESARRMGWHWKEAPVLAVLDLFSVLKPISRNNFIAYMTQISEDPHGPYGKVLLNSPLFLSSTSSKKLKVSKLKSADAHKLSKKQHELQSNDKKSNDIISLLKHIANLDIAINHQNLLNKQGVTELKVPTDAAALLVIDPQRSFTKGAWMKSIGHKAELEVKPIQLAFQKCAQFLNHNYRFIETMFTRCPFPPGSYDWDDALAGIIDTKQLYFIKPGNSVLYPPTNGFREWVDRFISDGKKILVIAGCTLNSCVRISAIETQQYFKNQDLQIVVDLSLAGARTSSFRPSSLYGGLSAVGSAVQEMIDAKVRVTQHIRWI
ncbi:MAG: hypothetical protein JRJ46_04680 [Deltaproteobacteria bacterium]|nr:hypothetical protein [Deltaproteobacteria bacterium]